ncbi:NADPH-dependent FMN reductase [Lederbergia citri]|uniref:NAD(P)H-dependent oxidoreductase n=1 Tax=Lederbergia citri TaxID=2833580 RepID=A0A942YJ83_9BACI|nr:NAD(P)H-dependent oxidoreductase [Lederbergia citri]MBS4196116.1 NAD(P)H-dependent oxidoreductase [Lederbergia citri]
MRIVGISGALSGQKTSQMVYDCLYAAKKANSDVEFELIDLKDFDIEFMQGLPLSYYNDETQTVVKKILKADGMVIGTPIYQASISGSLKNLLDLMPERAFNGKVVGYISNAGSEKHFMVAQYNLEPIIRFLGGIIPPKNVFVNFDHFDPEDNIIIDKRVKERIMDFGKMLVEMTERLGSDY